MSSRIRALRDGHLLLALAAAVPVCLVIGWEQPSPDPGWVVRAPWHFLLYAAVHPVLEEVVFRGLVQETIAKRTGLRYGPLSAANLLTSLLFAAAHLLGSASWLAAGTFLPSLVFGYFRERHDSLASPIALHAFYNSCALLLLPQAW